MLYNNINNSQVSELGMGFIRHSAHDFLATQKLVDYAISRGMNYFEACTFYLEEQCEKIVGNALSKYPRESYILCNKIVVMDCSPYELNHLDEFFNTQLQKCQTEYFDFYLFQAIDKRGLQIMKANPHVIEFFRKKKEEGIIKNLGFSFHDTNDVLLEAIDYIQPDCVQIQLNYYDWYLGVAKDLYFTLRDKNIPIFVMCALKGGTIVNQLPAKIKQDFYAAFPDLNLVELGLNFLRNLSGVKMVLIGAERIEWLKQDIDIYEKPFNGLTKREHEIIKIIIENYKKYSLIKCTKCGYCLSVCPRKIDIPHAIEYYNLIISGNDPDGIYRQKYYDLFKSHQSIMNCAYCGLCERKCPQHLPIREIENKVLFPFKL